ncbi:MAG: hypothetical protein R6V04_13150 [bacterium]
MKYTMGIIVFLIVFIYPLNFYAQQNFKDWLQQEDEQFSDFLEKRDKEFTEFLKNEWKEFELTQGIIPDEIPKPAQMPVKNFEEVDIDSASPTYKMKDFKFIPAPKNESLGFIKRPKLKFKYVKKVDFYFLNTSCSLMYDVALEKIELPRNFDNTDISRFWSQISKTHYSYLLDQCNTVKNKMKLNDWAFYKFLSQCTAQIFPDDANIVKLVIWFIMQKSGYDVKVGYSNDTILLLISSQNILYNHSFITSNNRRYYLLTNIYSSEGENNIHTYCGNYPDADSMIDMNIYLCPAVNPHIIKKTLEFDYLHKNYSLSLNINKSIVDFYTQYPLTEYAIYFNAPISNESRYSLLKSLKPLLVGKSEIEAVNLILHFVQKSFTYTSDYEQFGNEQPLFIEETLYYPGSDCEDRAVLFAYLIRNLLKLDVLGLDYPGHIATAVKINTHIDGKYISYCGENYIECDPTYVNANAGQCLPKYRNVDPEIISFYDFK